LKWWIIKHAKRFRCRCLIPNLSQPLYLGIDFFNLFNIKFQINELFAPPSSSDTFPDNLASNKPVEPLMHNLSLNQRQNLNKIIDSFPSSTHLGLGRTNLLCHKIDTGLATPVKQRHYAVSPAVQAQLNQELDRMLGLGVLEESESPWNSPVTLVKKSNGKVRLCLDARRVNEVTVKDAYPLPIIDGILSRLENTNFISSLDLKDAFWQIPLDDDAKCKTAFTVPNRPLYQFTVMPFGLCNAPQTMCRLMHKVIPHEYHDKVFVYLDDLLITSVTFEEHLVLLKLVALWLRKANLTINVDKSRFVLKQLKYLGYVIGEGCIRVDPDKVNAIIDFPVPKTVKHIRRFLGMCGWYRKFIANFSTLSAPLTDLLKSKSKITWNDDAQQSFENLKRRLTSAPVLVHPNYNLPFYIQVDASSRGVGGVLFQKIAESEHPIAYFSKKLNGTQRKYSVTELECYAAVLCVKHFRHYVEGFEFTIITDHASLRWLMNMSDLSGRLARWSLKLQCYKFSIEHRKGSLNVVPDTLSRAYCDEILDYAGPSDNGTLWVNMDSPAFQDEEYVSMINKYQNLNLSDSNFRVEDGKLLISPSYGIRYTDTDIPNWKLVLPKSLIQATLEAAHIPPSSGHMGAFKTLERLRRYYFWFGMAEDVRNLVKNCSTCKMSKAVNYVTRPPMGSAPESTRPFQRIYIDFLGPYPRSRNGNTCVLIVLDHYSKFVRLKAFRDAAASSMCDYLEKEIFLLFSVPEILFSDNGRQFQSHLFVNMLNRYGIQHIKTPFHSPQSNASERTNRTILQTIRSYIGENHVTWDIHLDQVASTIRNVVHSSTTYSPHYLVYGQHMIGHGSDYQLRRLLGCENEHEASLNSRSARLDIIHQNVLKHLREAHLKSERYYNMRSGQRDLTVGQQVFVRTFFQSAAPRQFSEKLAPKYIPAIITARVGNVAYTLKDPTGKILGTYHAKDIRL